MSTLVNSKILVESQRASGQDTLCQGLMMHTHNLEELDRHLILIPLPISLYLLLLISLGMLPLTNR